MTEWSQLTIEDEGYGVGPLPGRKQVCLYKVGPGWIRAVAFFRDEDDARQFLEFMVKLSGETRLLYPEE